MKQLLKMKSPLPLWIAMTTLIGSGATFARDDLPMEPARADRLANHCELAIAQSLLSIKLEMLPQTELGSRSEQARRHNQNRPRGAAHAKRIRAVNEQSKIWRHVFESIHELNASHHDTVRGFHKIDANHIASASEELRDSFAALLANEMNNFENHALRRALGIPSDGRPVSVFRDPRAKESAEGQFKDIPSELDVWRLHTSGKLPLIISQMEISKHDAAAGMALSQSIANAMRIRYVNRNKVAIPTVGNLANQSELSSAPAPNNLLLEQHLKNNGDHYQRLWDSPQTSSTIQWETGIHRSQEEAQKALQDYKSVDPEFMSSTGIQSAKIHRITPRLVVLGQEKDSFTLHSEPLDSIDQAREFLTEQGIHIPPGRDINQGLRALGEPFRVIPVWKTISSND